MKTNVRPTVPFRAAMMNLDRGRLFAIGLLALASLSTVTHGGEPTAWATMMSSLIASQPTLNPDTLSPEPVPPAPPTAAAKAAFASATKEVKNPLGMTLKLLPPGIAVTQCPENEEYPGGWNWQSRRLTIPQPLYFSAHEVTQKQYRELMNDNPSVVKGDDLPVTNVRWEEALKFCRRLSAQDKQTYRLPTFIEWEYACRAGATTSFHFGDSISSKDANFQSRHPVGNVPAVEGLGRPVKVGSYRPNKFGLFDMHGNVSEWCTNATFDVWDNDHVVRGGGFDMEGADLHAGADERHDAAHNRVGFRIVRELKALPGAAKGDSTPERLIERLNAALAQKALPPRPIVLFAPVTSDGSAPGGLVIALTAQGAAASVGDEREAKSLPRIFPEASTVRNFFIGEGDTLSNPLALDSCQARLGAQFRVHSHVKRDGADHELAVTVVGPGMPQQGQTHKQKLKAAELEQLPGLIAIQALAALKINVSAADTRLLKQPYMVASKNPWHQLYADLSLRIPLMASEDKTGLSPPPIKLGYGPRSIPAWSEYLIHQDFRWRALHDLEVLKGPKRGTELAQIRVLSLDGRLDEAFDRLLAIAPAGRQCVEWHQVLLECAVQYAEEPFIDKALEWFRKDHPGYAGRVLRGDFLIDWAWHARGGGWAHTVKEEDWPRFHDRLEQAMKELETAPDEFLTDWKARQQIIIASMGLSRDVDATWTVFTEGVTRRPDSKPLFAAILNYLRPRWHGSADVILKCGVLCTELGTWENGIIELAYGTVNDAALGDKPIEIRREIIELPQFWTTLQAIRDAANKPIADANLRVRSQLKRNEALAFFARWAILTGHAKEGAADFRRNEETSYESLHVGHSLRGLLSDVVDAETASGFRRAVSKVRVALSVGQLDDADKLLKLTRPAGPMEREQIERLQHALAQARQLDRDGKLTLKPQDILDAWLLGGGSWVVENEWLVGRAEGYAEPSLSCPYGFGPAEISGRLQVGGTRFITIEPDSRKFGIPSIALWGAEDAFFKVNGMVMSAPNPPSTFRYVRTDESIRWEWDEILFKPIETENVRPAGFTFTADSVDPDKPPVRFGAIQIKLLRNPGLETQGEPLAKAAVAADHARQPVPVAKALDAARQRIGVVLANEIKNAKTPDALRQLASQLLTRAGESTDAAERYALLSDSIVYSQQGVDPAAAMKAVDELGNLFDLDVSAKKLSLLKESLKSATASTKRSWAIFAWRHAEGLIAVEEFAPATEILALGLAAANDLKLNSLSERIKQQQQRAQDGQREWLDYEQARKTLREKPLDKPANSTVGRYLCRVRRQWHEGLTRLAMGSDGELTKLATLDLAAPRTAVGFDKTASAWFDYANRQTGSQRQAAFERVAFWYQKASREQTDATAKANAEQRLLQAQAAASPSSFEQLNTLAANAVRRPETIDCRPQVHTAEVGKEFDITRSWVASFDFKTRDLNNGLHMLMMHGDDEPGQDAIWFRYDGHKLFAAVCNTQTDRGTEIITPLHPQVVINHWVNLKFVHDADLEEIQLHLDNRLIASQPTIRPFLHRTMPVHFGGAGKHGQRYEGEIRNVWFGNVTLP